MHLRRSGQSLTEYGLILALITMLCIASLTGLGRNTANELIRNLASTFAGIFPGHQAYMATAQPAWPKLQNHQVTPTDNTAGKDSASSPFVKHKPTHQCAGSWCITLDQKGVSTPTLTVGANGNMKKIQQNVRALKELVETLAADPKADNSLVDQITQLANQGHLIALAGSAFNASDVSQDKLDVSKMPEETVANYVLAQRGFSSMRSQIDTYLTAHPEALPLELKTSLHTNALMIDQEATTYITAGKDGQVTKEEASNANSFDGDSLQTIHHHSNNVCKSGGREVDCIHL